MNDVDGLTSGPKKTSPPAASPHPAGPSNRARVNRRDVSRKGQKEVNQRTALFPGISQNKLVCESARSGIDGISQAVSFQTSNTTQGDQAKPDSCTHAIPPEGSTA